MGLRFSFPNGTGFKGEEENYTYKSKSIFMFPIKPSSELAEIQEGRMAKELMQKKCKMPSTT